METTTGIAEHRSDGSGEDYPRFLATLRERCATVRGPLFRTDASGLFDAFLTALLPERRQVYTCQSCRRFLESYGALAEISPEGRLCPAMWDSTSAPEFFRPAVRELERLVTGAKVTGVFYTSRAVWGVPENTALRTGKVWRHMAVTPAASLVFAGGVLKNAEQAAADKLQERGMLRRALEEFPLPTAIKALALLKSGNLYRSEKAEAIARWFVELHETLQSVRGPARDNLSWLAVSRAPAGFSHVRATMIGTLLEDVAADMPFEDLKRRWDAKMDPLQYMRPQAAPTEGNIAQAEKVVAALDSAGALERRFARLEDLQPLWMPAEVERPKPGRVFGHIKAKGANAPQVEQPAVTLTFEKFRREVLDEATAIEALVPTQGNFVALVTTVNPEAPPILQWDTVERRNPVNWYVYPGGSLATQWGLEPGWVTVTALTLMPQMWNPEKDHGNHGKGVFVLLEGCRDQRNGSVALFPEVLKAEYRPIRATIEAFSRTAKLQGVDEATACGLDLRAGRDWQQRLLVTDRRGVRTVYLLDRWD